jgi:hypothetical protein
MHVNSLCACLHSEVMKGSSSLRLLILSRLLASPVWAQLTLTDPTWGARSLYLQNGDPFHRVHAHSLNGAQNSSKKLFQFIHPSQNALVRYFISGFCQVILSNFSVKK